MVVVKTMIVAGIGSRKGVTREDVLAAIDKALAAHGLARGDLSALATTAFKKGEGAIFEAGRQLGIPVIVVEPDDEAQSTRTLVARLAGRTPTLNPSSQGGGRAAAHASCEAPGSAPRLDSAQAGEAAAEFPSPLWGGVRGGGGDGEARTTDRTAALLSHSERSLRLAGTPSVSEAAALAAAGDGAELLGARTAVGPVTCAIAISGARP